MKKFTLLLAIVFISIFGNLNSQSDIQVSPGRILDTVQVAYGIYFVTIINPAGNHVVKKLIISK